MAIRSGLGGRVGMAAESVYGTAVTVSRFLEFTTESLVKRQERIQSQGIRAGTTVQRTRRWAPNDRGGNGAITYEVADAGFGLLFKHALGQAAIATPSGATDARLHHHTLGDLDDLSLTIQKGVPDTGGVVRPFTFLGAVITDWELSLDVGGLLMFTPTFECRQMVTNIPLASPSFPDDDEIYHYQQALISLDNAAVLPTSFSLRCASGMKTDRDYLAAPGTRGRPLLNAKRDVTGSMAFEFEDMTQANRFINGAPGTEIPLDATVTGREIEAGHNYGVGVRAAAVRFDDGMPTVQGPDVVSVTATFAVLDNDDDPVIEVDYTTTDTAS